MRSRAGVVAAGLALLVSGLLAGAVNAAAPTTQTLILERGQRLADALEYLRAQGLRVVYSDSLVGPELTLPAQLRGENPETLARAALRPFGMELRSLEGGMVAVVAARAQRWQLRGQVLTQQDHMPVAGARVELVGEDYVAWSDAHGAFLVRARVGDTARMRVSAAGYGTVELSVAAPAGELSPLAVVLSAREQELEEVTVIASRFAVGTEQPGAFVLDQATFSAQPKNGEDALQATRRLPGFAFSSFSGEPSVRGGEAGEMLLMLDNMPIREPYHLPGYNSVFSAIDEQLVARLTSYFGSMPARYGNRLAAVLDVESIDAGSSATNLIGASSFNLRLQLHGGGDEQGTSGNEWLVSTRHGTLGSWLKHAAPDLGRPDTTDAFFKFVRRDADGSSLSLRGLLARSVYAYEDDEIEEWARMRSRTSYLWAAANRDLAGVRLNALLGHSWIDSEREGLLAGGLTPYGQLRDTRRARIWDLRFTAEVDAGLRHRIEAGLGYSSGRAGGFYDGTVRYADTAVQLFSLPPEKFSMLHTRADRDLFGLHVEDRWQLRDDLYLELGARLDRVSSAGSTGRTLFSPRASLRWNPIRATALRIGWSRAHQVPEANELRIEDGETLLPGAQRADQTVLSLEHHFQHGLVLRAEAYDRRMPDPRPRYENYFDQLRVLPELAADRFMLAPERARAQGVEFSALWEKGGWTTWGAYTRSHVRDREQGEWFDRAWDQRHALHLSAAWRRGPWTLAGDASLYSGRPATPFVDESLLSAQIGPHASIRYPGRFSLDFRATRAFRFEAGDLHVYLQLTNALNTSNRCCTELDLPDESSDPLLLEIDPQPGQPLVPALGFYFEF